MTRPVTMRGPLEVWVRVFRHDDLHLESVVHVRSHEADNAQFYSFTVDGSIGLSDALFAVASRMVMDDSLKRSTQ